MIITVHSGNYANDRKVLMENIYTYNVLFHIENGKNYNDVEGRICNK